MCPASVADSHSALGSNKCDQNRPLPDPYCRCARSNNGESWADHVLPSFEGLGVRRTDILVANFALWINEEDKLRAHLAAVTDYVAAHADSLPFIVWRDSSVQHFNVRRPAPAWHLCGQPAQGTTDRVPANSVPCPGSYTVHCAAGLWHSSSLAFWFFPVVSQFSLGILAYG